MQKAAFIETARIESQKDRPITNDRLEDLPVVNKEFNVFMRKVLSDQDLTGAIYDSALQDNKAWSYDSVIGSDWGIKMWLRGIRALPDDDKKAFIKIFADKLKSLSPEQCVAKGNVEQFVNSFTDEEMHSFFELSYKALRLGTNGSNRNSTKAEYYVAVAAVIVEAKTKLTDEELWILIYNLVESRGSIKYIDCHTLGKAIGLINDINPRYRKALFNYDYIRLH